MSCGTDINPHNDPRYSHIQTECENIQEYYVEYEFE